MIQRGEVDCAVADLRRTEDRERVIDFTRQVVRVNSK